MYHVLVMGQGDCGRATVACVKHRYVLSHHGASVRCCVLLF